MTDKQDNTFGLLLDVWPKTIAFIWSIGLFYATAYNWIYFSVVGGDFFSMLTITDHIVAAIEFTPILIVYLAVVSLLGFGQQLFFRYTVDRRNPKSLNVPAIIPRLVYKINWILLGDIFLLSALILFLLFGHDSFRLFVPIAVLVLLQMLLMYLRYRPEGPYGHPKNRLIYASIAAGVLLIITLSLGLVMPSIDKSGTPYVIVTENDPRMRIVRVLRHVERGTIVHGEFGESDDELATVFYPKEAIDSIWILEEAYDRQSLMCIWLDLACKASDEEEGSETATPP